MLSSKTMQTALLLLALSIAGSVFAQDIGFIPIGPDLPNQAGAPQSTPATGQPTAPSGQLSAPGQPAPYGPGQTAPAGQAQAPGQPAPLGQTQAPAQPAPYGPAQAPGQAAPAGQAQAPGQPAPLGQTQAPAQPAPYGPAQIPGQVTPAGQTQLPTGQPPAGTPGSPLPPSGIGQPTAAQATPGQAAAELSEMEKYVSGKAPQELIFDIRQFGYEYFAAPPSTFAPVQNVPVGPDYVIGPGDEIRVNVWGGIDGGWNVTVDRDGTVSFPKIGTIGVAGLTYEELKKTIFDEFSKSYTDFQMNASMGQLRSMRVYLVGNARRPGTYSISSLSTLVNALFEAGGPNKVGSMRDLQVIRNGETLVHFDLYDFLLRGQKTQDIRLMPEDVVFIPTIGPMAGIAGNVKVPAIYEMKGQTRVSDIIRMAGGVTATAYLQRVQVERVFENKSKIIVDLDLQQLKGRNDIVLANGDLVKIFPIVSAVTNKVVLRGNVSRPGDYQWREGMTVLDIIKSTKDLMPDTLMDIARIDRLVPPDNHMEYRIFSLGRLLIEHDLQENIRLQPYDTIVVFNKYAVQPKETVRSQGALYSPGIIEFRPNMKLSDLIKLSGGLKKNAVEEAAELTRVTPTPQGPRTEKITVYPANALNGDLLDDITLQPDDYLLVRSVPEWDLYKVISLTGEVRYPGTYTFQKGEKLSSILSRAGGFTDRAYIKGAVYTRPSLKQMQQAQLRDMVDRLERELLASGSAEAGVAASAEESRLLAEEQKSKARFVQSLKQFQAKGRLVVSLDQPDKLKNSPNDISPEDWDTLHIPVYMDSVQVIGAVNNQTALTYRQGKDYSYYVNQCGGFSKSADKGQMYVVRADGRAIKSKGFLSWSADSSHWGFGGAPIEPGDTIVVPDDLERISWIRGIKDITQILANVASSVGVVFVGLK